MASFPSWIESNKNSHGRSNSGLQSNVPTAKKPKSRPPRGFREKAGFVKSLPKYSGSYSVGVMDIEVPVREPRTFSNITRHKQHILKLDTVLFTLYYPAALGSGTGKDPGGHKTWSRATWLPRPRIAMSKGYGKFAGIGNMAIPFIGLTTGLTKLPAYRNAELARHWAPEKKGVKTEGWKAKNEAGQPPVGGSMEPTFPLLIFSHGLGGTRMAYSMICGEVIARYIPNLTELLTTKSPLICLGVAYHKLLKESC
jgi:platelet-activating factor acetylhydrolase